MASNQPFKKGDRVQWSSGSGTATGKVEKRITEDQQVEGKKVSASKEDPRYLVKNDSTGNLTGHRPDTLSKADSSASGDSSDSFEKGDRVKWNTRQGKTTGTIQKKLTDTTEIEGHTAKASADDPQYLVESESTGSKAAHKPDALEPDE